LHLDSVAEASNQFLTNNEHSMSWTQEQSEANAALNAQEFANRQITLKGDGAPTFNAPFSTLYWDLTADPKAMYQQMDLGIASNWVLGNVMDTINGGVFIKDIIPQGVGNVGGKQFNSDDNVLESAVTDTDLVTVSIIGLTGNTHYKPEIKVAGQIVNLTQGEDKAYWEGDIDIDLGGATEIEATHEDGATHLVSITPDFGPVVLSAEFIGGYPNGQTELKAGDEMTLEVVSDVPMTSVFIDAGAAAESELIELPSATTTAIIPVTIADKGAISQVYGVSIRAINENGTSGAEFDTNSAGALDGVNVVTLNNTFPSVSISDVTYPSNQLALKDSEEATLNHTISGQDSVLYLTPESQLLISGDATLYEPAKTVSRIAGDYNVGIVNLIVEATRAANGAVTSVSTVVSIAHVAADISIDEQQVRLRSGGSYGTSAQNHAVLLTSDQMLLSTPVISAPLGTLQAAMVDQGDGQTFMQDLRVHDTDEKGIAQFELSEAVNLAGRPSAGFVGNADYELGGFVKRTILMPVFSDEVSLGTAVRDTSKLLAQDKDLIQMTYSDNFNDGSQLFTIVNEEGQLSAVGNTFHWNDSQAVNNNSTGLASITIEELA